MLQYRGRKRRKEEILDLHSAATCPGNTGPAAYRRATAGQALVEGIKGCTGKRGAPARVSDALAAPLTRHQCMRMHMHAHPKVPQTAKGSMQNRCSCKGP